MMIAKQTCMRLAEVMGLAEVWPQETMMMDAFENYCWRDLLTPEMEEIYSAYRRKLFVGPRPAILAIDLYEKAYQGGNRPVLEVNREFPGSCGEFAWAALEPTQRLFAAARKAGVPILYSTRHADTNGVQSTYRNLGREQTNQFAIKEEVAPHPQDLIIYKERASAFFGTPLIAHLRRLKVESLIVCGESTSGCVRASTVDAYSYGFHSVVVEECTYDRSLLNHKINLFDLHHKYADVMHVQDVIAHLDQMPK